MMKTNCSYILYTEDGTEEKLSYWELVDKFRTLKVSGDLADISDIIFSKDKLEIYYSDLLKEKADLKAEKMSRLDGEPNYTEGDDFTSQTLIDSPSFNINGQRPDIPAQNDSDYVANATEVFKRVDGLSDTEAKAKAEANVAKWKVIRDDAISLHLLLNSFDFMHGTISSFIDHCQGTKYEQIASKIYDLVAGSTNQHNVRRIIYGSNLTGKSAKVITGLNLKTHIDMLDKDLCAHYDYLVIDSMGVLHIYNYKISENPVEEWDKVKMEKYKYQMALLRQTLANKGYDITGITSHLIPVRLFYNDDYSEIDKVEMKSPDFKRIDIKSGDKYDTMARYFLPSKVQLNPIDVETTAKINDTLLLFFPKRNINIDGIQQTAQLWIKANYGLNCYNRIKVSTDPNYSYEVYLTDDFKNPIKIKETTHPYKNNELLLVIILNLHRLNQLMGQEVSSIVGTIKESYKRGTPTFDWDGRITFGETGAFLSKVLAKYVTASETVNGKPIYDWLLLEEDTLTRSGILLFKNKTGLIDVIVLTNLDLRAKTLFERGNTIAGGYLMDADTDTNTLINYPANFANIEAIRALTILNEVIPTFSGSPLQLGTLLVLSTANLGTIERYDIKTLNTEAFLPLIKAVTKNVNGFNYLNNFTKTKYKDPVELLITDYNALITGGILSSSLKLDLKDLGFSGLENIRNKEAKITILRSIVDKIKKSDTYRRLTKLSPEELVAESRNASSPAIRLVAKLLIDVYVAIAKYSDMPMAHEYKIATFLEIGFTSDAVANRTYRGVTNLLVLAIDNLAFLVREVFNPTLEATVRFLEDSGYSTTKDLIIGNLNKHFENLYKLDLNGNRLMEFRNPFVTNDGQRPLSSLERKYLKTILFELTKIRCELYGITFPATNPSDALFKKFIDEHPNFLNVPLFKAASESILQKGITAAVKETGRKLKKVWNNAQEAFLETVIGVMTEEEATLYRLDSEGMNLTNPAIAGDGILSTRAREEMLSNNGVEFYETNIANVMANYIESYLKTKELNKVLITSKGVILLLYLLGDGMRDSLKDGIKQTVNMIKDYLNKEAFKQSLMEPLSLKLIAWLMPFRLLVSRAYIAGNVISAFRDTFEGIWLNMARTINHYLTDINAINVGAAYKEVVFNAFKSPLSVTIIDELCKIYRLSNLDASKIAESMKIGRGGIFNVDKWMYSTLRGPDFLNRMVLFVARCILDGCWDAFSVLNGKLSYDWKKDKRFSVFAANKHHEDLMLDNDTYWEQKEAYYREVRLYNREHEDSPINFTGEGENALPVAYSNLEIEQIKTVANSIYGAYDSSMRAKYESLAIGWGFGMFTTWMNGMVNNYFLSPGLYYNRGLDLELEDDGSGNLLFLDNNGQIVIEHRDGDLVTYTDEDGNIIENPGKLSRDMKYIPRVVLGIWNTMQNVLLLAKGDEPWENLKTKIWDNPMLRANCNKAISDLIAAMLFLVLFKCMLDEVYQDHKKNMDGDAIAENLLAEVMYKSSSRSYDGFLGALNIILFAGENTNPPIYLLPLKLILDSGKFVFGDKTFGELLTGNIAVFKWCQDTYKAANKE